MPTVNTVRRNKKGQLWLVSTDHNNNVVEKHLGNAAFIKETTKTFETKIISLVLEFFYGGKQELITIPRSHLQTKDLLKYADYGLNINRVNANYVVEDLQKQERAHTPRIIHEGIGFDILEETGADIFKCHRCMGMESTYVGSYDIKPKGGKLEGFQAFLRENVYGTPMELAVVIGLAGVLVGYLAKDVQCPNIVTNIYGDSSTGKSSFAVLAVSMGSNPHEGDNSLFRDFYGTDNGIMAPLVGNYGYPICYDEANRYQGKDYSYLIYNMEGGTQKQRLSREGKVQERGTYHTSIITTAEKSINNKSSQNAGQGVRILEFGNIAWTRNAEHSEQVKEYALYNYGRPIIYLAKKVLKLGREAVINRFKENRQAYIGKSKANDGFTNRLSIKYAILLTTLQLANECMGLDLSYDYVMDMLVESEYATSDNRDIGQKAYDYLVQMFNTNPDKFSTVFNRNMIHNAERETWGIQDPQRSVRRASKGNYRTIVYFAEEKFKLLLEKGKFESIEVVLKRLKEIGYLDCPSSKKDSRYYRKRKITSAGSPIKVYGILLFDDPEIDSNAELKEQLHELEMLSKKYAGYEEELHKHAGNP